MLTQEIKGIRLSDADKRILDALRRDGRLSWVRLGKAVNLSPSACQRRVEALTAAGIIRRFTVALDPPRMGLTIEAFIEVKVARQDVASADRFRQQVAGYPEVSGFYKLSGATDYLLKIAVRDIRALSEFLDNKLLGLEGVVDASSKIVLDELPSAG